MRIHILQHESFESPGFILDWIAEKRHHLTFTKFYEDGMLPPLEDFDWLIIMGGPMGVYEEVKFPWLKSEKEFIKRSIEDRKIVLGICLGAQLIAAALGEKVYPNKNKEIGWLDVKLTSDGKSNHLFTSFPEMIKVCQWHGDTFDLPAGAILLAESEACINQAFIYKDKTIALQFHLEFTKQSLRELIAYGKRELVKDKFVQTGEEILSKKHLLADDNKMLNMLLDKIEELKIKTF